MDFNQYDYDRTLAEEGRRIPLGGDAYLIICRWANKRFIALFNELTKPYGNAQGFGKFRPEDNMSEDEVAEVMYHVVAKTILTGWGGMTDDGEPLEYSVENAIKMFKKHEKFMQDVIEASQNDDTFRTQTMDKELGNSETSSEATSESEGETEEP